MRRPVLIALLAGLLAASAARAAGPGPPVRLSGDVVGPAGRAQPSAGIDDHGDAVVAWVAHRDRFARVLVARRAGGAWTQPQALDGSASAVEVHVGVGSSGRAIVAWRRGSGSTASIRYVLGSAGRGLGSAHTLPGSGRASDLDAAISATGTAAVLWRGAGARGCRTGIRVALRYPGHGFRAAQVPDRGCATPTLLSLSMGGDGTAAAAWLVAGDGYRVRATFRRPGHGFARARAPGTGAAARVPPAVAAGLRGRAVLVWRGSAGHDVRGARGPVRAALRTPGERTVFAAAGAISASERIVVAPAVAMDARGAALAVWIEGPTGHYVVRAAPLAAGATAFGAVEPAGPEAVSDAARISPAVGLAADGRALAAWPASTGASYGLIDAVRPPGGPFAAASPLSSGGYASRLALAVAPGGAAVAAWVEDEPGLSAGLYAATGVPAR